MLADLARGAIAGAGATWLVDRVTTALLADESAADRAREADAAPNGRSSTANLAVLLGARLGIDLTDEEVSTAATALHWALGIVPAAAYGLLRDRVPLLGSGRGLAFGRSCSSSTTRR